MRDSDVEIGDLETMRTTCPTCETAYTIPDERIGAKGRKVRCTKCGDEWRVMAASETPPITEAVAVVEPAPPPVPPAPATAPPSFDDPFDRAQTGRGTFADDAPPATPPAAEPAHHVETRSVEDEALPAPPPLPPGRKVHIRTKSHFPRLGKNTLAALAGRVQPFVGPGVLLAAALTVTGVFVFRQTIVAAAPDLAGLYASLGAPVNLRGLVFGRIETLREIDNGQPVLVVEGSISNVTPRMRQVPALRFALRGVDTQELYAWSIDPRSTSIDSGDTIRFRTRLAAPPDLATEVQVRFVERRSKQAGLP